MIILDEMMMIKIWNRSREVQNSQRRQRETFQAEVA